MNRISFFRNRSQHQQQHINVRPSTRVQHVGQVRAGVVHHRSTKLLIKLYSLHNTTEYDLFFRNRSQHYQQHLNVHPSN